MGKLFFFFFTLRSIFVNSVCIRSNFATVEKVFRWGCALRNCYRALTQIPLRFVATRSSSPPRRLKSLAKRKDEVISGSHITSEGLIDV